MTMVIHTNLARGLRPRGPPEVNIVTERTRKQNVKVTIRLIPEAKERLKQEAQQANISVSALIKSRVFGQAAIAMDTTPPKPTPDLEALRKILGQLGKIGSNINQIARQLNQGNDYIDQVQFSAIRKDVHTVRNAVLKELKVTWDR